MALSGAEQRAWQAVATLMTRLPAALDTQLQRESGMTHFEYRVLAVLSESPGCQRQLSSLAADVNGSLSRLSHVVTKLERGGYLRRQTTVGVRGAQAVLTEAGLARVSEATPGHVQTVRALLFDGLRGAQLRALTELGEVIAARVT